jgi:triphosphatase
MSKDTEIELKLAVASSDVAAFRQTPILREKALGPPVRRKVFNIYLDTPDLALKNHAMALRLRRIGGKWFQTLKTAGEMTGGLQQRGEWEFPCRGPQLDLALFRDTPLALIPRREELHLMLRPVFTTDFYRTAWLIETEPGQRVEVALDLGAIRDGSHEVLISEVEIELVEGGVSALFAVALALSERIALRPDRASKAERGYALFQSAPMQPQPAAEVPLRRKWPPHEAMRMVTLSCLSHLEANVEGALVSDDPEYVHQLRVALRRLRSAIRVFKPANVRHLIAELKWLTNALSAARDWDVLMTELLPKLLDEYGDTQLTQQLVAEGKQHQSLAREAAREALASSRYTRLAIAITRWITVPGELVLLPGKTRATSADGAKDAETSSQNEEAPAAPLRLIKFARRELRRRQRRLLRVAVPLANLSVENRHQVRIDVKRLRYSVEFFASLFDKHRVTRYVSVLREVQDVLGGSNDAAVAIGLINRLAPPDRFCDFARGWFAAHTQMKLGDVDRSLADLKDIGRF